MEAEAQLIAALQQQQSSHHQQSPSASANGIGNDNGNGGNDAALANASGPKGDMAANMAANRDHLSFRRLESFWFSWPRNALWP